MPIATSLAAARLIFHLAAILHVIDLRKLCLESEYVLFKLRRGSSTEQ